MSSCEGSHAETERRATVGQSPSVWHRLLWPARLLEAALVGVFLLLIGAYRLFISPLLRPSCRFAPSCSEYAAESFRKYGLFRGLFKTCHRLGRCHPFCEGGHDPP